MHYIVQENLFKEQHYVALFDALHRLNLPYTVVRIFPFVDKIVAIKDIETASFNVDDLLDYQPDNKHVFVFGAIKLARIAAQQNWKPGSMMNANHDFLVYSKFYKDNLLNYDSEIVKLSKELNWRKNETKFIRPTLDSKAFTGKVFTETEWKDTVEHYLHNFKSAQFNENTLVQVSSVKEIYKEIRIWVVNGKIITASQYRLGNAVIYDNYVEDDALQFAQSMIDLFQLAAAFVIDVCLTDKGWKVVECGCVNCAGFYKADLQKLLIALEEHL